MIFYIFMFVFAFFALTRHISSQHTPTTLQPVLKCAQRYDVQSTIG